MISCFKGSATDDWKTDFENTHAFSYTSTSDLSDGGPKISKIVESFKQYNVYKYAAYRTAFKIRTIQKAAKLHLVDLAVVNGVLKDYDSSASLDKEISLDSAAEIICALYTEASKRIGFAADPDVMSHLFCALLQNAFAGNENSLLLVQMKITLVLFSSAKLSEKHKYMFYYCSNDGKMDKNGLQMLLTTLSKLAEVVGEQVTFGSHLVNSAVQNCLKFHRKEINETRFKKWMALEPQTLVWLSTMHRIAVAETAEHHIICDYCQNNPFVGFRYKCLQCLNYNLCQNCFLRGFMNKGHKENHPVQEFCLPASIWQETKAAFSAVKNKLPFTKCPSRPYLSFEEESICDSSAIISNPSIAEKSFKNCSHRKSTSTYLIKELSSIISKIDEERKQIALDGKDNPVQQSCSFKPSNGKISHRNSLQDFDTNLGVQLERLRDLLKALKSPHSVKKETVIVSPVPHVPFHQKDHFFESTPINSAVLPLQPKENLPGFTPKSADATRIISKKRFDQSSDYSSQSYSSTDKENFAFSGSYNTSKSETHSISLELTKMLNSSSIPFDMEDLKGETSKISPLYVCSSLNLGEPVSEISEGPSSAVSPKKGLGKCSSKMAKSTFSLDEDGNFEIMEQELQAMIQHLEELLPRVSFLANESIIQKEIVISALSEMEEAVQKLSHLSIEVSTGSTDL